MSDKLKFFQGQRRGIKFKRVAYPLKSNLRKSKTSNFKIKKALPDYFLTWGGGQGYFNKLK
jgi:hypothetical protein